MTVVLTLALGVGVNTAIFTVADQVPVRPLPVPSPGQLVSLRWDGRFIGGMDAGGNTAFSYPAYEELAAGGIDGLMGLAARYQQGVTIEAGSRVDKATAEFVFGNYFEVLSIGASVGRTLVPEDDEEWDGEPHAVLSEDYRESRFGRDPGVIGQTSRVNGVPVNVVGVARDGFRGFDMLDPADLFMSLKMEPVVTGFDVRDRRDAIWLRSDGALGSTVRRDSRAKRLGRLAWRAGPTDPDRKPGPGRGRRCTGTAAVRVDHLVAARDTAPRRHRPRRALDPGLADPGLHLQGSGSGVPKSFNFENVGAVYDRPNQVRIMTAQINATARIKSVDRAVIDCTCT